MDVTASPPSDTVPLLETAHVLFMDIVGYSRLPMEQQSALLTELNGIVRATEAVRREQASDRLIRLPTGDGMALVFFAPNPIRAMECAIEISRALLGRSDMPLRMGVHSGPVYRIADINASSNVAGGGINLAQRVMDCGDARHILISSAVADVLSELTGWKDAVRDLGEVEVKHGVRIHIYNYCNDKVGNADLPAKLSKGQKKGAVGRSQTSVSVTVVSGEHIALAWSALGALALTVVFLVKLLWFNLVPWSNFPAAFVAVPHVSVPLLAGLVGPFLYQYWWEEGGARVLTLRGLVQNRDARLSLLKLTAFCVLIVAAGLVIWRTPPTLRLSFAPLPIEAGQDGFDKKFQNINPDYFVQRSSHYEVAIYTGKHNPEGSYMFRIGLHPYGTADGAEFAYLFIDKGYSRREAIEPKFDDGAASAFFEVKGTRQDFVGLRRIRFAGTYYSANTPKGEVNVDLSIQAGDRGPIQVVERIRPDLWKPAQ